MTVPLRFSKGGRPEPLGVRAAAAKMSEIVATTEKRDDLTPDELRIVLAVSDFFAEEYTRISEENERLAGEVSELQAQIRALEDRLRDVPPMATDGGVE